MLGLDGVPSLAVDEVDGEGVVLAGVDMATELSMVSGGPEGLCTV